MKTAIAVVAVVLLAGCAAPKAPPGLVTDVQAWGAKTMQENKAVLDVTLNEAGDSITVTVDGYAWDRLPPQTKRELANYCGYTLKSLRLKNGLPKDSFCSAYIMDKTGTRLARASTASGVEIMR